MVAISQRRFIVMLLAVGVLVASESRTFAVPPDRVDMDISAEFRTEVAYGKWELYGEISIALLWTPPKGSMAYYVLRMDGTPLGVVHPNTAHCWVVLRRVMIDLTSHHFPSTGDYWDAVEDCWADLVAGYTTSDHVFRLDAYFYGGKHVYDELYYKPPELDLWNHTLYIKNCVPGLESSQEALFTYVEQPGNSEHMDANDVLYETSANVVTAPKIISTVPGDAPGQICELTLDARPGDGNDVNLELSIEMGLDRSGPRGGATELKFSFPEYAREVFDGCPLTIQRYDPLDPRAEYPVWDVRAIVDRRNGTLALEDIVDSPVTAPYAYWSLSTTRELADIDGDGVVDLADQVWLDSLWGSHGSLRADIAGVDGLGLPDGVVDRIDGRAFFSEWVRLNPGQAPAVNPYELGTDFEDGFGSLDWVFTETPWHTTTSQAHAGSYCARAGEIGNSGVSAMTLTVDCADGKITYWRKVSSEANFDFFRFFIDDELREEVSGRGEWEQVSVPVTAGAHVLRWAYEKDSSGAYWDDTVYVDTIEIP